MAEPQVWTASRLLEVINRRRRIVFWTTMTLLAVVTAFVVGLPDLYRASASLLVQGQMPEVVTQAAAASSIDGRLQTIKQQALSRARLTEILNQFGLYGVEQGRMPLDRALERLQRDIRVEPTSTDQNARGGAQTIAFRVSYVGNDPKTAADVANALASFFVAQNDEMRAEQASRATEFLGAQMADTRRRLDAQEARVRSYSARNTGILPQQIEANIAQINRLDAQLRLNDTELLKLIERRQSLKNDIAAIDVQVPAETDTSPQAQRARLERDLADARMRFGPNYPDVKAAQAKLDAFNRSQAAAQTESTPVTPAGPSRKTVLQQALAEVESQIEHINGEDKNIKQQIADYQGRVERAPAGAPVFDGIVRDYQSTRDQFDALSKRYNEAQLAERAERRSDTQEFRVLDAALPPTATAGPTRTILFGIGLLLVLLIGIGVAVVVDRTDTSFHSVDDLRHFTKVPVLASIPLMTRPPGMWRRVGDAALAGAGLIGIAAIAEGAFMVARASDQVARLLSRVL